ncbi:holin [Romboutsia weinsteinii]|uniref:Holin n=1 Tax=Romboutsia weinsteinii TaxID=2020949 RepID=A0A371J0H7_9FIRM|nr:phage holin family protein [Romboutsia weinsteinii]RDY26302.1 holin [Romboutsia weinsteinii]
MDLTFLQTFYIPTIVGICLCVGYVIKHSLNFIPNKYIPLIMAVLGLALNIFINKTVTADIILGGMFSGLASTGLHQMFSQMIQGNK